MVKTSVFFTGLRAFLEVGISFQFQGTFIWESMTWYVWLTILHYNDYNDTFKKAKRVKDKDKESVCNSTYPVGFQLSRK